MIKVIMTWDIQENKEREYIDFAVNELSPTLGTLGLQINDVWYTVVWQWARNDCVGLDVEFEPTRSTCCAAVIGRSFSGACCSLLKT